MQFAKAFDERRFGKVRATVESSLLDALNAVQSRCVILRCEHHYIENQIVFDACSPDFEPVSLGYVTPFYDAVITDQRNDEGEVTGYDIQFARVNS